MQAIMEINSLTPHFKEEFFESSMDLYQLESRKCFTERNSISPLAESNRTVTECGHCNDKPDYECTECTCQICGHKTKAAKRYRCYSCKKVFHEWCQNANDAHSQDHWQCMNCKPKDQIVRDELVSVRYTRQIIIRNTNTVRKINNAPRSRECTSVPANHFGPIPDVPVGTCWEYRLQASEAGVHRPLVAGIHGRENEGAYSIVLSGVYPDDHDKGDEFFYSGCGGKEKDPSKRLGAQVRNQTLTKHNRALALCCDCPINDKEGGTAKNWRNGKPVRVIRNYKLSKFSKFAPKEGNRYDGIYKVVKYFPQKGLSGYMIWRYLLRRDDPTPAPWTPQGRQMIRRLGLKMIKASPSIAEKAEEYEEFKIEIDDEEPLKKRLRRIPRDMSPDFSFPPKRRRIAIAGSSEASPNAIKEELLSPPPTPDAEIKTEIPIKSENPINSEIPIKSEIPINSEIPIKSEDAIKSSPTANHAADDDDENIESTIPIEDIKSSPAAHREEDQGDGDDVKPALITDIKLSPRAPETPPDTYGYPPSIPEPCPIPSTSPYLQEPSAFITTAGHFTPLESTHLSSTYKRTISSTYLNSSMGDTLHHTDMYKHSITSCIDSSGYLNRTGLSPAFVEPLPHMRSGFDLSPSFHHRESRICKPLPIHKVPLTNLHPIDRPDIINSPLAIRPPMPMILKPTDPIYMPPLPIESATEHNYMENVRSIVIETNGRYDLNDRIKEMISNDVLNKYWWDLNIRKYLQLGQQKFLEKIQQTFTCPICHNIIDKPVTLRCEHTACFDCLSYRFEDLRVKSCPTCQEHQGPSVKLRINENLSKILLELFPGYNLKLSYLI